MSNRRTSKLRVFCIAAGALATLAFVSPSMASGRLEAKSPENGSELTTRGEKAQKHKKHRHTKQISARHKAKNHRHGHHRTDTGREKLKA